MSIQEEPNHEIVDGIPGGGKSFLVLYKLLRSLEYDRPCCYIDPKGETYWQILAVLTGTKWGQETWKRLRHRILLLNPVSESDQIVGFNAIEPMGTFFDREPDKIALIADTVVTHLRRQSNFELYDATRMQGIMRAAIGLLVDGGAGKFTIAEIPQMFTITYGPGEKGKPKQETYNTFVQHLLRLSDHLGTNSFWRDQWANWSAPAKRDWTESTRDRIASFIFDNRMLYTTCAVKTATLDFRRVLDQRCWLFVHIPFDGMGETTTTLLGNLLITKLHYAAMQRQEEPTPYRIILDEAKFFNTGPLERILETSRAYNLWLTMVVQSLSQMCRTAGGSTDTRLRDAILDNCRYFSVFNSTNDGLTFGRLMFPATGRIVTGQRSSGDNEYLPVAAEEIQNAARFKQLQPREIYLYDKFANEPPRKWRTPTLNIPRISREALQMFEEQHLLLTGKPSIEVADEIRQRQAFVDRLIHRGRGKVSIEEKPKVPSPSYEVKMP